MLRCTEFKVKSQISSNFVFLERRFVIFKVLTP